MRKAVVRINNQLAGWLVETDERKYLFSYDPSYLALLDSKPVSLTMPLRAEAYSSDHLFPYFYAMLSEGANRAAQCSAFRIDLSDDFGLLLATAAVDTIGYVTVEPV